MIGKSLHFKCNCIFPLDTIGKIINYELIGNEIVFLVDVGDKQIKIGENHPNLYVNYPPTKDHVGFLFQKVIK